MNTVATVAAVAAIAGGTYLGYDYIAKRGILPGSTGPLPGASGTPLVQSAIATLRNRLPVSVGGPTGRPSMTPYPALNAASTMTGGSDSYMEGSQGNVNTMALQTIAAQRISPGWKNIIAALASCETMTGSLRLACWNCNLFNMHATENQSYVLVGSGTSTERIIDFRTGRASQVEGFIACINYFMDWLQRRAPLSIAPGAAGDFREFTLQFARQWGATSYISDIRNNTVPVSTLARRFQRLTDASLATR